MHRQITHCQHATQSHCIWERQKKGGDSTLAAQEKVLAHGTLVVRVFSQVHRINTIGEHGTHKVDGVAQQQTVRYVDVGFAHSKHLPLDHGQKDKVILASEENRYNSRYGRCQLEMTGALWRKS